MNSGESSNFTNKQKLFNPLEHTIFIIKIGAGREVVSKLLLIQSGTEFPFINNGVTQKRMAIGSKFEKTPQAECALHKCQMVV